MKMRTEYTCPLELVHDMIKGKWKPIILWRLRLGATSLAKLERDIDGITQKMLLEQLKELMVQAQKLLGVFVFVYEFP